MNPSPVVPGDDVPDEEALLAHLRETDPAAGAVPDGSALRAAVDHQIASEPVRPAGVDELAAARARRWTSWPARLAGAAAAALVIGGTGGYALGVAGDRPPQPAVEMTTADGPVPGAMGGLPERGSSAMTDSAAAGGGMAESVAGEAAMAGDAAASYGGYGGRTVFSGQGLPEEGGSAVGHGLDPASAFSAETVAAVAAVLGVEGEPELQDGMWVVGSRDGTTANVSLMPDGFASISYYDPAKDPWSCAVTEPSDGARGTEPVDPCTQRDLGPAPEADVAMAQLREVIAAAGLDPADYELVEEELDDRVFTHVSAHQTIDGRRTGMIWSASFNGAGLQSVYGSAAPVIDLGEYEVISPRAAVERLSDPRFGNGWGGPMRYVDGAGPDGGDWGVAPEMPEPEPMTVPPAPAAGSPISWPVDEVTIVDAQPSLVTHIQRDGAALLVPGYDLISQDGGIWSVIAVAERHLDLSPQR